MEITKASNIRSWKIVSITIIVKVQIVMILAKKKSKVCPGIRNFNINGYLILPLVNDHILGFGRCFLLKGMECFAGYVKCMIHRKQQQVESMEYFSKR